MKVQEKANEIWNELNITFFFIPVKPPRNEYELIKLR